MAVYTKVSAEEIEQFLSQYDVGSLVSAKGIAEGVENSNYLIETTKNRFILTLYEKRVDPDDLPFFVAMLDHLASKGCPVPPMISDRTGKTIQQLCGRYACLIAFLPGFSVTKPTIEQSGAAGAALGGMHQALADFEQTRPNEMNHEEWRALSKHCGESGLNGIGDGLSDIVAGELEYLDQNWPKNLPQSVIHADLFPDNVLMLGNEVTGLIDFYFSCSDIRIYDLAITHTAWCFSDDDVEFLPEISAALIDGYAKMISITKEEHAALPVLSRAASMRFLLSRAYDWINTPADALVIRKDPRAYVKRLQYYQNHPEVFAE